MWYWVGYIFAFIGMFLNWYIRTQRGIKYSEKSPGTFSFTYWVRDNIISVLLSALGTLVILFVFFRFFDYFFVDFGEITVFAAFLIGYFFDIFVNKLKSLKPPSFKE